VRQPEHSGDHALGILAGRCAVIATDPTTGEWRGYYVPPGYVHMCGGFAWRADMVWTAAELARSERGVASQ